MFHYHKCVDFWKRNGHCIIPNLYPQDQQLGNWAKRQRCNYMLLKRDNLTLRRRSSGHRPSSLTSERIKLLDGIGFCWEHKTKGWMLRYQQLQEFANKYGHTMIGTSYEFKGSKKLATWVKTQRQQMQRKKLGLKHQMYDERIELLNMIGFVWEAGNK